MIFLLVALGICALCTQVEMVRAPTPGALGVWDVLPQVWGGTAAQISPALGLLNQNGIEKVTWKHAPENWGAKDPCIHRIKVPNYLLSGFPLISQRI